mmetsp:Transcript_5872/g.8535  ORF Transcript_5872/g.8535 Transcript_5872/m.8535 type:complete len:267 (-) Transcript_5872:216-1016(-)
MIFNNLLLDTTITVSTHSRRRLIESTACRILRFPSNSKGFVTMATVKAPSSLAISETTGAAPDPVPPPIPAVTKHKSVPSIIMARSSRDSSAAKRPTSGLPPAPSPLVTSAPIFSTFAPNALLRPRACASVLIAQYSTPPTCASNIRSTALQPPPPTPNTRITHGFVPPSGISGSIVDFNSVFVVAAFTLLMSRNPRKVPLPSFSLCGCLDVTNGSFSEFRFGYCCMEVHDFVIRLENVGEYAVTTTEVAAKTDNCMDNNFIVLIF